MGPQERRLKEKEAMKRLIIDTAIELVHKEGLESLTIRSLAKQIEYSPSIIYEYFENKELICKELCRKLCGDLLRTLKQVSLGSNPEEYLLNLMRATVDYLRKNPQGMELLNLIDEGSDPTQIPPEYLEIVKLYTDALTQCHCRRLQSPQELEGALDVIRSLHVGMITRAKYQKTVSGLQKVGASLENGIQVLLRGWKN